MGEFEFPLYLTKELAAERQLIHLLLIIRKFVVSAWRVCSSFWFLV